MHAEQNLSVYMRCDTRAYAMLDSLACNRHSAYIELNGKGYILCVEEIFKKKKQPFYINKQPIRKQQNPLLFS